MVRSLSRCHSFALFCHRIQCFVHLCFIRKMWQTQTTVAKMNIHPTATTSPYVHACVTEWKGPSGKRIRDSLQKQQQRTNDKKVPANHQMLIKNIMKFFSFVRLFVCSHLFCVRDVFMCVCGTECVFEWTPCMLLLVLFLLLLVVVVVLFPFGTVFYTLNSSLCDYDKLFMEKRLSFSFSVSLFRCCCLLVA